MGFLTTSSSSGPDRFQGKVARRLILGPKGFLESPPKGPSPRGEKNQLLCALLQGFHRELREGDKGGTSLYSKTHALCKCYALAAWVGGVLSLVTKLGYKAE